MARIQLRNAAEPPATPFERGYNIILDDYPGDPVPIFPDGITLYAADSAGDGTSSPYIQTEDGTVIDLYALATGGGGGVTSVSGTANRITSSGGATPVIDIAATYVGQTSITTLGTITTGVWNGTAIGAAYLDLSGTQPLDSDLTAIAALTTDSFGRGLLIQTSAANVRSYIGAGTGAGTVTSVTSANSDATIATTTTTPVITIVSAPKLTTARNINGVAFDGTGNITVTADAGTLTGTTLNATVVTSSLTTVGTIGSGTWQGTVIGSTYGGTGINNAGRSLTINTNSGTIAFSVVGTTLTVAANASVSGTNTGDQTTVSGNAGTATALATGRTIGITGDVTWTSPSFDGSGNVTAAATVTRITETSGPTALTIGTITDGQFLKRVGSTIVSAAGGSGTVTSVTSANSDATVATTTTTPVITIVSAPKWTTARNLAGNSVDGSGNVAFANKFIVQGTTDAGLSAAQFLGALGTGIVKNTTTTGVLSIAVAGDFPTLNQNTTGSAATLTTARLIGGVSFNGSADITVSTATAGFTVTGGELVLAAGTTTTSPLHYISGTNETTPEAGDCEYDGVNFYQTIDTSSSRGCIPVEQYFHLTADGGAITTIANFFGANSNIILVASAYYEIEIMLVFLKTTTEIPSVVLTNSAAPTSQNIRWEQSPIVGVTAPPGSNTGRMGFTVKDTTQALTIGCGSLTTAVNHYVKLNIQLQNGTGTSLKIQMSNPAGSVTPRLGSYWRCRRMSPNNIGAFNA